jgi:hypothetical protein
MSRSIKGSKPCGYDYWSRRPGSGLGFGKLARKITVRRERTIDKSLEYKALKEIEHDGSKRP